MNSLTGDTHRTQLHGGVKNSETVINALSVDVEEYYHATIFQESMVGMRADNLESRVEGCVDRILRLLADRGVSATFFVLGEVAAAHPLMVRAIAGLGHEVACHGYDHELVSRQSPAVLRTNVRRAKALLEDLIGQSVIGYRAPSFSIGTAERWAYDILLEEGFRYDSSLYPVLHDRYGQPNAPRFSFEIRRNGNGRLREVPIGTVRLLGVNFPIGGGGYFRLLPLAWVRAGIMHVNIHERQPIVFYLHPWELDPDQPRPPMSSYHRFRLYVGVRRMEAKLGRLLQQVRFSTVKDALGIL